MTELTYYVGQRKSGVANRFYVYLHRKKTTNEVFYVGKGSGSRAWSVHNRNKYWNNIYSKHGLVCEISVGNLTEEESLYLEVEFIDHFRSTGVDLANFTSGGDSPVFPEGFGEQVSRRFKGIPKSEDHKKKISLSHLLSEHKKPLPGSKNPNSDKNIYLFVRVDGQTFSGTRYGLCEKYNLSLSLLRGLFSKRKRKQSQGWSLKNVK